MVSVIENESFELDEYWDESSQDGGVADRFVAGGRTGSREAKIDTTGASAPTCKAAVYKTGITPFRPAVGDFVNAVGTVSWWIKIVADLGFGWHSMQAGFGTYDEVDYRWLFYVHHQDDIPVPSDTALLKYIDMGTSKPVVWTQFERNFREDYLNKFGALTHKIYQCRWQSFGMGLPAPQGQDLRLDDVIWDTLSGYGMRPGRAGSSINVPAIGRS